MAIFNILIALYYLGGVALDVWLIKITYDKPTVSMVLLSVLCSAMVVLGAFYLYYSYKNDSQEE